MKTVIAVRRLNFMCSEDDCTKVAMFSVDYKETGTMFPYSCDHYCKQHLPQDAQRLWEAMAIV